MRPTEAPSGDGFVARHDDRVTRWLATDEPLLVLAGGPGSGKTAFDGHVAACRPELLHHHACRFAVDRTLDPRRFVESLTGRLSDVIGRRPGSGGELDDWLRAERSSSRSAR